MTCIVPLCCVVIGRKKLSDNVILVNGKLMLFHLGLLSQSTPPRQARLCLKVSHLQILGGDDDFSSAVGGEAVCRREASARRRWRRGLGGFLCAIPGHIEIHCAQRTTL